MSAAFALGYVFAVAAAWNFTTANLGKLKFGINNRADPPSSTFNVNEDIYALAPINNAPEGKYKLQWRFTYDNVPGKPHGSEIGMKTVDFEASKQLWQSFSSPLPGEYKVEATLMDGDDGKTIDTKTGTVTLRSR